MPNPLTPKDLLVAYLAGFDAQDTRSVPPGLLEELRDGFADTFVRGLTAGIGLAIGVFERSSTPAELEAGLQRLSDDVDALMASDEQPAANEVH